MLTSLYTYKRLLSDLGFELAQEEINLMKRWVSYGLLLLLAVVVFLLVREAGSALVAPAASVTRAVGVAKAHTLPRVLIALIVVILAARVMGILFRYLKQPPVIGEIVAGILLGPSLLGAVSPGLYSFLLPLEVASFLGSLSQVGVVLYMFLIGLELDTQLMRKNSHATIAISHMSIVFPFLLGSGLALWLYPLLSHQGVSFTVFSLFLGVSMSVTAFPVLARILTDNRMQKTKLGSLALTCAAIDDVTAWCLLAFVISVARSEMSGVAWTAALTLGYIVLMFFIVRPLMAKFSHYCESKKEFTQGMFTVILIALLGSALLTELIGIHAVFGAFLLGAVIPRGGLIVHESQKKLEDLVLILLLPAFFAFTGMKTQIGLVDGAGQWLICGVIILVASLGKFGGSFIAARFSGIDLRDSASIGVLMNTRGLMELIVLTIGLDLGVIEPTLFAMMVIMALVTTIATTPILHWLHHGQLHFVESSKSAEAQLEANPKKAAGEVGGAAL